MSIVDIPRTDLIWAMDFGPILAHRVRVTTVEGDSIVGRLVEVKYRKLMYFSRIQPPGGAPLYFPETLIVEDTKIKWERITKIELLYPMRRGGRVNPEIPAETSLGALGARTPNYAQRKRRA